MAVVNDIQKDLEELAPIDLKMDFDNVGHLVGFKNGEVNKILVALDVTNDVIDEAIAEGAQLIVAHHPMFFGLKNVVDSDLTGGKIIKLIQNDISAICMHTNLDAAEGGVNTCLAQTVGIVDPKPLYCKSDNIGYYGELASPIEFSDFLQYIKSALNTNGLRYVQSQDKVKKVAVLGGSGGSDLPRAIELGCDTFITADLKYNAFIDARESGINLVDGDHFCTENVVVPALQKRLAEHFPQVKVQISKRHKQTVQFF